MKLTSSLIRELDRLARDHGWSTVELARELGLNRSTLVHARGGRRRLTSDTLAQIAQRFGASPGVRDLVWHYLAVEHPELREADPVSRRERRAEGEAERLAPETRKALRLYVVKFLRAYFEGRGLFLTGDDATALSASVRYLLAECARRDILAVQIAGHRSVTASEGRDALAAGLLLVERVDFASGSVAELLKRRGGLGKPFVVTSAHAPTDVADPFLARVLVSMTRPLRVEPAVAAAATTNA